MPTEPTAAPGLRAAVIGSPIGHSRSPALHAAAYRALGIACTYTAEDVAESQLAGFVAAVRRDPGWRGLSVTMPLKAGTARLMDTVTEPAAVLGVVNTVVVTADPTGDRRSILTGHNTDVAGVLHALFAAGARVPERAVVLGGGATASAAIAALAQLGAGDCRVIVRRPEAAADLHRLGEQLGIDIVMVPWDLGPAEVAAADILVSTLPPRGADALAGLLAADPGFRTAGTLLDVAYDPWPSGLAAVWQARGGVIVPGLDMLIHQAVEQVRLFFPHLRQHRDTILTAMCDAVDAPRH
ncbi:shikimate dehydrogenase [uncultured Arthrobacter sp.]|uniref:shikimate dehydrogenase n=1 Tax=uncultured Arthrobacter sp. TaxID=114050 RepID=UPI002613EEDC|nr:shikimate dehydrogenase [uncultured Arthrobacter sp.]